MVELSKWETGHHQRQIAPAAQLIRSSSSSGSGSNLYALGKAAVRKLSSSNNRADSRKEPEQAGGEQGQAAADRATEASAVAESSYFVETHTGTEDTAAALATQPVYSKQRSVSAIHRPSSAPARQGTSFLSDPVSDALCLAIKEALEAGKGSLLPEVVIDSLAAGAIGSGAAGCSSSSSGWAGAGSSRLLAALSAAEINMRLRSRVLQLESALVTMKAQHAGDERMAHQQQTRIHYLEQQQQLLVQQLAAAHKKVEDTQEKMQGYLRLAAAATAATAREGHKGGHSTVRAVGSSHNAVNIRGNDTAAEAGANTEQPYSPRMAAAVRAAAAVAAGGVVLGINADERLTSGGGMLRDLPVAAQQEIAAQKRVAEAAKRDKEVKDRAYTQLEVRFMGLTSKLVKGKQSLSHKESQVAQLQQALAAAHMALMDAGVDWQQQQFQAPMAAAAPPGILTPMASAAAAGGKGLSTLTTAASSAVIAGDNQMAVSSSSTNPSAAGTFASMSSAASLGGSDFVMDVALSRQASDISTASLATTASSVAGVNAAAAASWAAVMESRDKAKHIKLLTLDCADKQGKIDSLQQDVRHLQQQISRHQRAASAALAAVQAQETSRRQSLAGDLEGATTAMQDATRRLAASEAETANVRQQLQAAMRRQQQLEFDLTYLRARRLGAASGGKDTEKSATAIGTADSM
eukprot:GHRR01008442.1.p1 GENE.GHRR01008442.1~~GHRR01008442.1.p1  ORF type:complete len:692 (+),score=349.04 GHRR01008442.1:804-2879(+)